MKKNDLKVIYLTIQVDDILRYGFWATGDKQACYKDLFKLNRFCFLYEFERNGSTNTSSLRQISYTEYKTRRESMLAERPRRGCENWQTKEGNYELKHYNHYMWKKKIGAQNCSFFSNAAAQNNPMLACYQKALENAKDGMTKEELKAQKEKKAKIRQAFELKNKLNIAYENIVAIGLDESALKEFKKSYEAAIASVEHMTPAEQYQAYIELRPDKSRALRKQAIERLKINYFGADVYRLNLSELEKLLHKYVQKYQEESLKTASKNAVNLPHDERERLYNKLQTLSRTEKREILTMLGVDINAIGLNQYSVVPIKRNLAASLGIELEKF